jgi:hypothetical protein
MVWVGIAESLIIHTALLYVDLRKGCSSVAVVVAVVVDVVVVTVVDVVVVVVVVVAAVV